MTDQQKEMAAMDSIGKVSATLLSTSPTRPENGKLRQAFTDRLALSEAIEAVGQMVRGYANRGAADRGYIGAIAELLCQYPRSLSLECANPIHGVVITTPFMPTPHDIVKWMEPRVDRMKGRIDLAEGAERQLRERREYDAQWPARESPKYTRHNLLVRPDRPGYSQMCERSKHADPADFAYVPEGISVTLYWYHERQSWRPPQESAA